MTGEPVYLDYDTVRDGCMAEDARVGKVRYRKRPKDSGCGHARVTFGTPHLGCVDVSCDDCSHSWKQVKVAVVPEPRRRG
jgi:hypothetical protein